MGLESLLILLLDIYEEKESDQSRNNCDGFRLGLPFCKKLSLTIKKRIFFN